MLTQLLSTERLARASGRRPWLVLGVWAVLFVLGAFLATGLGRVLTTEARFLNEPESVRAEQLLEERLRGPKPGSELVVVRSADHTVDDPEFRAFVDGLLAEIRGLDGSVAAATSTYETGNPSGSPRTGTPPCCRSAWRATRRRRRTACSRCWSCCGRGTVRPALRC
ncbi:MAG TPA: hypothetical protein VIO14_05565 [Dehalococcoidia bacterium]